jgi:hypothetical protein
LWGEKKERKKKQKRKLQLQRVGTNVRVHGFNGGLLARSQFAFKFKLEISHCTNVTSKYGDLALQVGGVSDETVTALARPRSNCTVIYSPVLSSERALQNYKPTTV